MAFFRNFSNDTVSHGVMEDKSQGQNANRVHRSVGNDCTDATSSEKEFDMNMEAQYDSDGEPDGSSRLQTEATADDGDAVKESNLQTTGSKTAMVGRWGSTFWKDCGQMDPQNGSESGQESKSGSDYRNADGSEDNSLDGRVVRVDSDDDDGQKEAGKGPRGHSDVPAEEMLSDEYYEQDGEEQSDSLHYGGIKKPTESNSWPQRMSTSANRTLHRNSRFSDDVEDNDGEDDDDGDNDNDGDDADYEEEEEADEDDPDDADFEPATSGHAGNKDKDWEGEGSDDDDDSDGNIVVSDDDESFYAKRPKGRQRGKIGQNIKSTRDRKVYVASGRQRRVKSSFEGNESTTEDSDSDSDEDFKSTKKRSVHVRKNNGRSSAATGFSSRNSEIRTSSRTVRKVSYVESEESEEADEGKKKKSQKVALLNGITMGGGAGISIPGTFRVATDKTIFATPEVLIGFHPDAAASFYLSHLPGQLGEYLALTGEKLNGVEMVACGLATHYSSSARLPLIEEQLGKLVTDDPSVIETTLEQYGEIVHLDSSSVLQRIEVLDKCFCHDTVEEIVDAMENAASETNDAWCISTLNKLKEASPLSLKVALRSIREGRFQTLDQCLLREYRMTLQAIHRQISGDFCEGVRARVVDKDFAPKWDPPTLEKVSQDMVDHYFLPLSESEPDLELPTNNREAFL